METTFPSQVVAKRLQTTITPEVITDVTQRLRVTIVGKNTIDGVKVNGIDTDYFCKILPNNRAVALFFAAPDEIATGKIVVELLSNNETAIHELDVDETAVSEAKRLIAIRKTKTEWMQSKCICPECGSQMSFKGETAKCKNTEYKHSYDQPFHCINLLSSKISEDAKLAGGEFVSRHALSKISFEIIEHAKSQGGKVLDFGAGLKYVNDCNEHVINLEIEPYPTTDIVAAGQNIPFPDNTFDGIISFAVLEHVSDPFQCAKEIARVLKPGGLLCIGIPFLFHEHGYPEHYYNMTRRGVANLFEDTLNVTKQAPGKVCIPSLLKSYSADLSPSAKAEFEAMTIGDIVRAPMTAVSEMVQEHTLSPASRYRFAHGTYLWATKEELGTD